MQNTHSTEEFVRQVIDYIKLPDTITPYEAKYLKRMNSLALCFFLSSVPIFMLVAWIHDTGVLNALALVAAVMCGPVLAYKTFTNPRHVSLIHGFASMCMGGVLVHLGQGPIQIEMHFYFFILIAILSLFGNPMVIIVAALTVTAHHLLMYFLLPESVFNYDAPLWVVLVHALFVVLESIAVVFLARNFHDNVIGLEKIVLERTTQLDQRNQDMRLVLDNVSQGLMMIRLDGAITPEYSTVLSSWFGPLDRYDSLGELFDAHNPALRPWLEMGLEAIEDDFMPLEVSLSQLPDTLNIDDISLHIDYTPVHRLGVLEHLLVTFSDVTAQRQQERLEQSQREFVELVTRAHEDRSGVGGFFAEAQVIMDTLSGPLVPEEMRDIKRMIHTLKGNAGFYGLDSIAHLCHELEEIIQENQRLPTLDERRDLLERWDIIYNSLSNFLDNQKHVTLIPDREYARLIMDIELDHPKQDILRRIRAWKLEPVHEHFIRLSEQAKKLARMLDKHDLHVEIDVDEDLALVPTRWHAFWSAFVHVVRNAVDHGIESPDERLMAQKPPHGTLTFSAWEEKGTFCITLEDDGKGIDWKKLVARAEQLGVELGEDEDPADLLFKDGISSRDEVSETSGRGVGMAAVKYECERLHGDVIVKTRPGQGTTFMFIFQHDAIEQDHLKVQVVSSLTERSSDVWLTV